MNLSIEQIENIFNNIIFADDGNFEMLYPISNIDMLSPILFPGSSVQGNRIMISTPIALPAKYKMRKYLQHHYSDVFQSKRIDTVLSTAKDIPYTHPIIQSHSIYKSIDARGIDTYMDMYEIADPNARQQIRFKYLKGLSSGLKIGIRVLSHRFNRIYKERQKDICNSSILQEILPLDIVSEIQKYF